MIADKLNNVNLKHWASQTKC